MKKIKLLMNEGTTNKAILKLYVFSLNQARPILVKRRLKNFFFVNSDHITAIISCKNLSGASL